MPKDTSRPSDRVDLKDESEDRSSRRALLKRALLVLGAGALVQPNGAAYAVDSASPKLNSEKAVKHGPLDVKAQGAVKGGYKQGPGKVDASKPIKGTSVPKT